jgi:inositol transport system substrate-binding protein
MKPWKKWLAVLLTGCMMLFAAGCGGQGSGSKSIVFVSHDDVTQRFQGMLYTALETQAQALGYSLENTNATMDANKQIDQMNEVIAKKPGAIILLPVEANALKPSVEKANAAGVPVIITNRDLTGGKTAQVHSDEEQAGRMQGEYMAKHLPQGAKIVYFLGDSTQASAQLRWQGFKAACLDKRPDVELLAMTDAGWSHTEALKDMTLWLKLFPQIDGVASGNDDMALGALDAMKAAGRFDSHVVICGVDAGDAALKAVAAGEMSQTIKQDADTSVTTIMDLIQKMMKDGQTTDDEKVPFIEITKDNVSQFLK